MKRERTSRYCKNKEFDRYSYRDTRYYGVFAYGKGNDLRVKVDPKRFQKSMYKALTPEQTAVINKRKSHYFYPDKPQYSSYFCNLFCYVIEESKEVWEKHFKPLMRIAQGMVEKPNELTPGDCDLFNCGILEADEANSWATFNNIMNSSRYRAECAALKISLYAQFLHQFASQIEAITVKVLDMCKLDKEAEFNRNRFYDFATGRGVNVKELPSFKYYDKLYCVWHFIKHNSVTTINKLNDKYPEVLYQPDLYRQGDLAVNYLKLTDELVYELIDGCDSFFKECCEAVFHENYEQAQWNYGDWFLKKVKDTIASFDNPLGIPSYI